MSQNELTSDTEWMRIPTEAFEHKEVRMHIINHIISSAARGSGNVSERPWPYLQTHPPCLRILD